jgi:hypothetical protein
MGPGFLRVGGGGGIAGNVYINGNVGIGTNAPTTRLDVAGDMGVSGVMTVTQTGLNSYAQLIANSTGQTAGWNSRLMVIPYLGLGGYNPRSSIGDVGIIWGQLGSGTNGNLVIAPHSDSAGGLKIKADGTVGINTATPSNATLDVSGSLRVGSGDTGIINLGQSGGGGFRSAYIQSTPASLYIYNHSGTMRFGIGSGERMRIDICGNVGIGTTAPTATLDVNGGLKLQNSNTLKGIACGSVGSGSQTGNVSFGFTFDSIPVVTATIDSNSTTQVFSVTINSITKTGFNYAKSFYYTNGSGGGGATTEPFLWIAIGK